MPTRLRLLAALLSGALLAAACGAGSPQPAAPASNPPAPASTPPGGPGPGTTSAPPASVEPSAAGAAPAWNGTMTATQAWNKLEGGVMHTGTATSTFTGVWQPDAPGGPPIFACSQSFTAAPPCVVHRPTGTIKWTWDSDWPADAYQPGCHNSSTGSLPAGATSRPDTQSLVLMPNDKAQFQYWGLGTFVVDPQKCPEPINNGSNPPVYFDILEHASSQAPPDESGNTCFHTTWVIDANADAIAGNCDLFKYSYNSLHFEWNLRRVPAG